MDESGRGTHRSNETLAWLGFEVAAPTQGPPASRRNSALLAAYFGPSSLSSNSPRARTLPTPTRRNFSPARARRSETATWCDAAQATRASLWRGMAEAERNPFRMPTDAEVFALREEEVQKKRVQREARNPSAAPSPPVLCQYAAAKFQQPPPSMLSETPIARARHGYRPRSSSRSGRGAPSRSRQFVTLRPPPRPLDPSRAARRATQRRPVSPVHSQAGATRRGGSARGGQREADAPPRGSCASRAEARQGEHGRVSCQEARDVPRSDVAGHQALGDSQA